MTKIHWVKLPEHLNLKSICVGKIYVTKEVEPSTGKSNIYNHDKANSVAFIEIKNTSVKFSFLIDKQ